MHACTIPAARATYRIYEALIHTPFKLAYILIAWGGRPLPDICSDITGAPSHFWVAQPDQCDALIDTKFRVLLALAWSALYVAFLAKAVNATMNGAISAVAARIGAIPRHAARRILQ